MGLFLGNSFRNIEETRTKALAYLEQHPETEEVIARHVKAHETLLDLYPCTPDNFMSGSTLPYSEAHQQLEASVHLALMGFYQNSFQALRSVIELGIFGLYITFEDKEHEEVRGWFCSEERTPRPRTILPRFSRLPGFTNFEKQFELTKRIYDIYENLHKFVHTRGYPYSQQGLNRANINNFSETSLVSFSTVMAQVSSDLVVLAIIRYPIGMQPLPMQEKYGFNGPMGGLLEEDQVLALKAVMSEKEKTFLQKLSDENSTVKQIREGIASMPDISEKEYQEQVADWGRKWRKSTAN